MQKFFILIAVICICSVGRAHADAGHIARHYCDLIGRGNACDLDTDKAYDKALELIGAETTGSNYFVYKAMCDSNVDYGEKFEPVDGVNCRIVKRELAEFTGDAKKVKGRKKKAKKSEE